MAVRDVAVGFVYDDECGTNFAFTLLWSALRDERSTRHIGAGEDAWIGVRYSSGGVVKARNEAVKQFLASKYEWLWWLDTDIGIGYDFLDTLYRSAHKQNRPVVAGVYLVPMGMKPDGLGGFDATPSPTIYRADGKGGFFPYVEAFRQPPGLVEIDGCGSGCVLIHRSVFETLGGRGWYDLMAVEGNDDRYSGEDLSFCRRVTAAGIPMYAHTGIRPNHMKSVWLGLKN